MPSGILKKSKRGLKIKVPLRATEKLVIISLGKNVIASEAWQSRMIKFLL